MPLPPERPSPPRSPCLELPDDVMLEVRLVCAVVLVLLMMILGWCKSYGGRGPTYGSAGAR